MHRFLTLLSLLSIQFQEYRDEIGFWIRITLRFMGIVLLFSCLRELAKGYEIRAALV